MLMYFAYGSNMSCKRLQTRAPSARPVGSGQLKYHTLAIHKKSTDGSAKCDVVETGNRSDSVYGVVFEITSTDKPGLDNAEGLNRGYSEKTITVSMQSGEVADAFTYFATAIDDSLRPYTWYMKHILVGAREGGLPPDYVDFLNLFEAVEDPKPSREKRELSIYLNSA